MYSILLHFSTYRRQIQLDKVSVYSSGEVVWISTRSSGFGAEGCFSLTKGVKGACVVLVASISGTTIIGRLGSAPMTLEYALRKRFDWITHFFGPMPHFGQRLFNRVRSSLGITLSVNRQWCRGVHLEVDGVRLEDVAELQAFSAALLRAWGKKCDLLPPLRPIPEARDPTRGANLVAISSTFIELKPSLGLPPFFSDPHWHKVFAEGFFREAMYSLSNPAIFSRSARDGELDGLFRDWYPGFRPQHEMPLAA